MYFVCMVKLRFLINYLHFEFYSILVTQRNYLLLILLSTNTNDILYFSNEYCEKNEANL